MCENNQTQVVEFLLLGFHDLYEFKALLFIMFLIIYFMIINGNVLIIFLVSVKEQLNIPMFFFIKHIAVNDILLTTTVVPKMLEIIIKDKVKVSKMNCMIQFYIFGVSGLVQCFLLAVMSYDRYLAICNPLRYSAIMCTRLCLQLVTGSWLVVSIFISSELTLMCELQFCDHNSINHFYCDFIPLLELSSSDTSLLQTLDFASSFFTLFSPFIYIIITYVFISITILNISTSTGRMKAFSTCSSHLTIVCTFYGTLIAVYMVPSDGNINKFRSLLYIVITPLMNPLIYSLRNVEIRGALKNIIKKNRRKINLHIHF
ncbi:olfactory receptor 490-like [Bombina bombina]|uniref:olfactory receptor 490-like n=1 Tax=Bombina bombina TaxID=8345 RepID=UPI00235AF40C|nr:olfactory receptor 490-like [Bombina bombina]